MKNIAVILLIVLAGGRLSAQNAIDLLLTEIEKNNTTLLALQKSRDAELLANKTGLFPKNPEVEFNYLWGNPSVIGNRTDIAVKQEIDFPTTYKYKNQLSRLRDRQVEWEYKKQRNELRYQVATICVKLLYYNALKEELSKRHAHALRLFEASNARYSSGDANLIEFNKAQVHLLQLSHELEKNEIERNALLSELATFNGGKAVSISESRLSLPAIPTDFEQWIALAETTNPVLQWVKQEIAIAGKEVQLQSALRLPKLSAGYMSEKVTGEQFQGITVGLSVPLWESANVVKEAKARTVAVQSLETDAVTQFYSRMKGIHEKVVTLQNHLADYRNRLALYSNSELLQKAFDKGEISLPEYLYEISLYYSAVDSLLETEFSLNSAWYELMRYQE